MALLQEAADDVVEKRGQAAAREQLVEAHDEEGGQSADGHH